MKNLNMISESLLRNKLPELKNLFGLIICLAAITLNISAAPSDLDTTFGNFGKVVSNPDGSESKSGRAMALQSDGKIVMTGSVDNEINNVMGRSNDKSALEPGFIVARYNPDGSLDTTFGTNGWVFTTIGDSSDRAKWVEIQPDGKIVVGVVTSFSTPNYADFGVVRFNSDGSLDTTFDGDGKAIVSFDAMLPTPGMQEIFNSLKIADDGKIVLSGYARFFPIDSRFILARLNADGSLDTTFGTSGKFVSNRFGLDDHLNDLEIMPDGSIVVAGRSGGSSSFLKIVVKYDVNGNQVWTYVRSISGMNLVAGFYGVDAQPDGKIVAAGADAFDSVIVRLNADGTEDQTFVPPTSNPGSLFHDVAVQPDGKIVVNYLKNFGTENRSSFSLARYNADGSLDSGFGIGGSVETNVTNGSDEGVTILIQPDGKILVGGFSVLSSPSRYYFTMVRYRGGDIVPQRASFDYDGDGKSDVSVFRPSNGVWYVNQSTNGFWAAQFGISTDRIVPADYDGDNKTDVAIYRDGVWWILNSADNSVKVTQWGIAEDKPQAGDFDGDGKDDLAVFRPSTGVWYILRSSDDGFVAILWGLSEDIPVSADYDGDGRTDIAVFRPSDRVWYIQRSLGGNLFIQFGLSDDIPTANDYDGDGSSDIAVWRPSNGDWYVLRSSNGQVDRKNFGLNGDIPVAADYDGDGKADIAVFRPSNGVWYQTLSTSGTSSQVFGLDGDVPTPSAFNQ